MLKVQIKPGTGLPHSHIVKGTFKSKGRNYIFKATLVSEMTQYAYGMGMVPILSVWRNDEDNKKMVFWYDVTYECEFDRIPKYIIELIEWLNNYVIENK